MRIDFDDNQLLTLNYLDNLDNTIDLLLKASCKVKYFTRNCSNEELNEYITQTKKSFRIVFKNIFSYIFGFENDYRLNQSISNLDDNVKACKKISVGYLNNIITELDKIAQEFEDINENDFSGYIIDKELELINQSRIA
ncbi:MAG: hypothetical protein WC307_05795 [Candidatus Nanoarchaeia archaeon]|jgi:hypothetical protein